MYMFLLNDLGNDTQVLPVVTTKTYPVFTVRKHA